MKKDKNNIKISLMDLPGQYVSIAKQTNDAMQQVLKSGRYILGPVVGEFEEAFAVYCQAKYCVGTSSGTSSLFIALKALGIGEGDEVITVPNTFTATAEVVALCGAKIVFCDVDHKTMNIDPDSLKRVISKKTKAVIPVHLHGNPCDMDAIYALTKPKGIAVVEDAAQAHGALYKGKIIGSLRSEFTSFSFHPVKNLGAFGDAGALVTNNKQLAKKARMILNHGRSAHDKHVLIGFTGRIDTLQAAVLTVKLQYLPEWTEKRKKQVLYYQMLLPKYIRYITVTSQAESACHVFAILVKKRDKLAAFLKEKGIETGRHYPIPLHLQKAYEFLEYKKNDFSFAEQYAKQTLSLPLFPHISKKQIEYVVDAIKEFYER